jgi:Uma2 family endonuclease
MNKLAITTPKTAVEVFKLLPEGVHCQVINNTIYTSPSPTFQHQDIVFEITSQIRAFVGKKKLGKCIRAPIDVFLDENNAFQPDIIFLRATNLSLVKKDGKVHCAPDLIIELLSPSNESDDKVKKKKVYEAHGVKEYFIVDPNSKEVTAFLLVNEKFEQAAGIKGKIVSKLLKKNFPF